MDAFSISATAAAVVGFGAGAVATSLAPGVDRSAEGTQRGDVQFAASMSVPVAGAAAFLGMTTDTPGLFVGASLLAGFAAGGLVGTGVAGIIDARNAAAG